MKFYNKAQDPLSFLTHFIGALLSILAVVIAVIVQVNKNTNITTLIATVIFGLSMISLYSASSIYHYIDDNASYKQKFRKLDHAMIYILIVGTYTPLCVAYMDNPSIFLTIIWSIALIGIVLKMFWMNAPRWLSTLFYLGLGWSIILNPSILSKMSSACVSLIACGGISYSIGAIIYIIKKPNITASFGFHELFHIFILMGTLLHFIAVVLYT